MKNITILLGGLFLIIIISHFPNIYAYFTSDETTAEVVNYELYSGGGGTSRYRKGTVYYITVKLNENYNSRKETLMEYVPYYEGTQLDVLVNSSSGRVTIFSFWSFWWKNTIFAIIVGSLWFVGFVKVVYLKD
ncbi:hypothetical protein MY04_06800 [Flammeovirga sp. MY04]|uniref:hypothetical protein n=1 Tax=Flammeovirga sp. MY04 TaxID=1191459 RepID=UPI0008258AC1|nr:hypothetical protein [Flammeovirga sp. MY04]QJD09430.1 hypothetical protein MY04_06800 [Flammeovirga sp. MY04]